MTGGLFDYPQKAAFGRVLPKTKVFAYSNPTRTLRDQFAAEVVHIVWRFKLAPETINLPAGAGVPEIQIFNIELKPGVDSISQDILGCIDNAIPFPIIFELTAPSATGDRVNVIATHKRLSNSDATKFVIGDYFSTGWLPTSTVRSPLPVALDLAGLYEQILRQLIPTKPRPSESLHDLAERQRCIALKERECDKLKGQLQREKQFNRRVEINALLRAVKAELDVLTETDYSRGSP